MMEFDREREEESDELFQVSAMVDVVFILLAFFVLSVQFQGGERDLPLGYQDASQSTGASSQDLPAAVRVRLGLADGGAVSIRVGEAALPEDGFDALTALLEQIDMPTVPVVIEADTALSVQQVATGMDAVLASPMKRLSLSKASKDHTP
jgi:biopolymer transport protein ExbD